MEIQPVILCGGNGTRLWPLSTADYPKQFVQVGNKTLLQHTTDRLKLLYTRDPIFIINQHHQHLVDGAKVIEYNSCDTGIAVLRLLQYLKDQQITTPIAVFPSDHFIKHTETFVADLTAAADQLTKDNIVLVGLAPTHPSSKFGYILQDNSFIEKPDQALAHQLIAAHALWNSGIFLAYPDNLYQYMIEHSGLQLVLDGKQPSFDVAVLQKYKNIYCHKAQDWGWDDIGTWEAYLRLINVDQKSVNIISDKKTVVIGCQNLLVIDTEAGLLIVNTDKSYDDKLKQAVADKENRHIVLSD